MPEPAIYNIDEQVEEFFNFIVCGVEFQFQQMTIDELTRLEKIDTKDFPNFADFFSEFIKPVDPKGPSFKEISGKMTAAKWVAFSKMIKAKMTEDAND